MLRSDFLPIKALMEIGYYGFLPMEAGFSYRNAQPERFVREAYEYMNPPVDIAASTSDDAREERGYGWNVAAVESVSNP